MKRCTYNPTLFIALALALGVAVGLVVGAPMTEIKFVGEIFFSLVQMCMVPFVMGQIIAAVGSLTPRELGNIGIKAILLFFVTSLIAAAFGVFTSEIFKPGLMADGAALVAGASSDAAVTHVSLAETLTSFFSKNIVSSMAAGAMVPCIVFSLFFGVALSLYREKHKTSHVFSLIEELNELLLIIIRMVMNVAPVGVFAYVSSSVGALGISMVLSVGKFILVLFGTSLVFCALWYVVVALYCRLPLGKLFMKTVPMVVMSAATISSAMTLPVEMEDAKRKIGLRRDICDLVLPLGVPLNSNGKALQLAVTAMFVAQLYGMEFTGGALIQCAMISWLLSFANAAAPGGTLISLTMLFPALGLPMDAIAIVGGLEYITAGIGTPPNVISDVFCGMLVAQHEENGINRDIFFGKKDYVESIDTLEG
ncbi:dicarboxylate/amino acid:cation symporter [Collinsella sp. zg1085]|uniref:dicarboxylate/amino acid:cation symporter n=1 Tax=Collinsella sp. zg1085 TaxID=2844380 RepID=UPI00209A9D87|nr:dicarboxylate/amino acid:cation symporter [Collinsella sp. zg1085]